MQYSIDNEATDFSLSPVMAIDASMRFVLGAMLCLCELFVYLLLARSEFNEFYYLRAIAAAICVLGLVMRFGEGGLLLDIKELCLYEVFAHIVGLVLFSLAAGKLSLILVNAVLALKIIRLFWISNGQGTTRWPTFGLWGLLWGHRVGPNDLPAAQRRAVVVVLLLSPILGYFIGKLDKVFLLAAWATVPILYLLLNAKRLFSALVQIPESLRTLAHERDQARVELQQLRQSQADAQSKEQQALVSAYYQVRPDMRAMLLPIVEEFSAKFPMNGGQADSLDLTSAVAGVATHSE